MRTSFLEIYNMAIAELKDPQLKATLAQNPVMFCKVMYNFFVKAILHLQKIGRASCRERV